MVSIEEVTMTQDKIDYRVLATLRIRLRISSKYLEDITAVVVARRNLTVGIVRGLPTGPGKSFDFIPFGVSHKSKVGIGIPPTLVKQDPSSDESILKPVLEVELLVSTTDAFNQLSLRDRIHA